MHFRSCPAALSAAAGASVTAPPDSIDVNGRHLNLLDAMQFLRTTDPGDVRFVVMPVPDSKVVLLTFGHQKSPDQYCFPLQPDFAEQMGQLLIRSSRQVRGVSVAPT